MDFCILIVLFYYSLPMSKLKKNKLNKFDEMHSAKHIRQHALCLNDRLFHKNILVLMKEIDAKKYKVDKAKKIFLKS